VKLTRFRAEAMQSAVPEGVGAMAAVLGLDDDIVRAVCNEAAQGEVLEAVNLNSPGQVVIAGNKAAVERGMALAKEKGAKRALPLPVSVPSHSALMKPAADQFRAYLGGVNLRAPEIPVLQNADVQAFSDADAIKDALARQLHSPVRWVETVQALAGRGIERCVECGPGKVLAGLSKRINDIPCVALVDEAALQSLK
jgi:[acyl-carrier-protein] S-malonyltransferase